jgi:E3 ubiquitin-protein ligase SHPRH
LKQATGLTLTVANHVFIIDPIEKAHELQAIGRAYRIGQQQNTFVHRYFFKDSIEEEVENEEGLRKAVEDQVEKKDLMEEDNKFGS